MGVKEFTEFYKEALSMDEKDFECFLEHLNKPLPLCLRVTNTKLKKSITDKLTGLIKNEFFDDVYTTSYKTPQQKDFIINQTNIGTIQRQEIVSMLPILLMNLSTDHYVLDMCAAPGSKTKQILEIVKNGLVIANDCRNKRLNVLVTETTKLPNKSFIVTKHDAAYFPNIGVKFDRILCDVPCSGDGTIRKSPDMLDNWNLKNATNLCTLQYNILKRSTQFIKDDGLIIYSTCSFNPIENEHVVSKVALEEDMEIVDLRKFASDKLKEFCMRKGLVGKLNYNSVDSVAKEVCFQKQMERAIRIYPQDQDTGGFFIVGLKKKQKTVNEKIKEKKKTFGFKSVSNELHEKVKSEYKICDMTLIHKTDNILYNVSCIVKKILEASKLNVIYCGYKAFEKSKLNVCGYRQTNVCTGSIVGYEYQNDLVVTGFDTLGCLQTKEILCEYKRGSVNVLLKDLNITVSGFSFGTKISLFISNNMQKALLDLVINE